MKKAKNTAARVQVRWAQSHLCHDGYYVFVGMELVSGMFDNAAYAAIRASKLNAELSRLVANRDARRAKKKGRS